jgi:hypothetical protein
VQKVLAEKQSGKLFTRAKKTGRKNNQQFWNYTFKEALNDFIFTKINKNEHLTVSIIYEYCYVINYAP